MLNVFIALGIFGTVLLLMYAGSGIYRIIAPRGSDRAVERLQAWTVPLEAAQLEIVRKESLSDIPWLDEVLKTAQRLQPFRALHRQADCRLPLGLFALAVPMLAVVGLALALSLRQTMLMALLLGGAFGAMPLGYLYWLKNQRMATFERQLPEALELVSRALRAGHALSVGLKIVGDEAADPIGQEFRRVYDEIAMGVALPQALQNMTERVNSVDVRFFVTSVMVQRETGGNLAEIIDSLAGIIRSRFELLLKVSALSAEGRFSAVILLGLPVVVGALLYKMNPDYMGLLFTDPMGQTFITAGSIMMVLGAIVMKRMVNIKV